MEDKIALILKNYREGKTSLTSRELAKLILSDVRTMLPKMDGAIPNADKKYTVPYEELSHTEQQEHEGCMWGWQDCVTEIDKVFGN